MSKTTRINPNLNNSSSTVINPDLGSSTVVNPAVGNNYSSATAVNAFLSQPLLIDAGTILCDEFTVVKKLSIKTGEADLYLCKRGGKEYAAKVYRRKLAVKQEVVEKLKSIDSPNIARVYATGTYDGYPVEVISYYKNGSLQEKRYNYSELKNHIIPSLNTGLHILHNNGIIHKDLKPSNIMLNDNGVDVSIIDFGISSIRESGNTVIVTQTGMTPEYSAPETFKSLFLSESDYYSLGVTIYELFCGHTPYGNLSGEEREKYILIQKIPFPDDMPEDLQGLIRALTYNDITNRKNKDNPNRRWGYEEVLNWCNGVTQPIPGEGIGGNSIAANMRPYTFLKKSYTDRSDLVHALGTNWADGKKQLFRGVLSAFFKPFDPETASYCLDAEEEAGKRNSNTDAIFLKTLYKIDPETSKFYWRGKAYSDLEHLGTDMLSRLQRNDKTADEFFGSLLEANALTIYANNAAITADPKVLDSLTGIEASFAALNKTKENRLRVLYTTAYMLSGKKNLRISDQSFESINDIAEYMNKLITQSYSAFSGFCESIIDNQGKLDPQFESWLSALGQDKTVKKWRDGFNG